MGNEFKVTERVILGEKGTWRKKGTPDIVEYSYKAPDGKVKKIKLSAKDPYLTVMNPYSTNDNPELTPSEVFKIKKAITKKTKGAEIRHTVYDYRPQTYVSTDSQERSDYFQLLDLYSNPESPGGSTITPEEQAEIVDTYVNWYY